MKISNHRLVGSSGEPVPFVSTRNMGGVFTPQYLVMHYTAGRSAQESISWFQNPHASASAHLVVGRDGGVTQMVPFNRIAWHAGRSRWLGLEGMNRFSIGIEMDNAGLLTPSGDRFRAWFGDFYKADDVLLAAHKNDASARMLAWHRFTPEQIEVAVQIAALLTSHYNLKDVLGHEDISPGRKTDPGPAFPMASFRSRAMGRQDDKPEDFRVVVTLNIRTGAGTQFPKLDGGPLPKGTIVEIVETQGDWSFVDVNKPLDGQADLQGWVFSRYLEHVS